LRHCRSLQCPNMTSCRDAIKLFEANATRNKDKTPAVECKQVKLYFMIPPITKMDGAALCTLTACEHLALSTNNIDKIANLSGMENLRILSLGRNNIKKLENLDGIGGRLEELWVSYNPIDKLTGIEKLKCLKVLFMGNCKVSNEKEFQKLAECPQLEELVFFGNPIHRNMVDKDPEGELAWPRYVLTVLPNLRKLDGTSVVEWQQMLNGTGNENKLKEVFDKMDKDGSQTISVPEMKDAIQDTEIQTYLGITPAQVETAFKEIDSSGNGQITWDDFKGHFFTG